MQFIFGGTLADELQNLDEIELILNLSIHLGTRFRWMSMKQPRRLKHVPQRTCIVCHQKVDKRRLTRIVRTPDEGVVVDLTGKRNGRGAYLCDRLSCWEKALAKTQLLNQALMTEVTDQEREEIASFKPTADKMTE